MKIRHATTTALDTVCEILACEFYNDCSAWRLRERRIAALRYFFRIQSVLASRHRVILLAENDAGVMVYFRPDFMEEEQEDTDDYRLREVYGIDYPAVTALMNGLNHYTPGRPLTIIFLRLQYDAPVVGAMQ